MKIKFQLNVSVHKNTDTKPAATPTADRRSFTACVYDEIANARRRGCFSTAANYQTAIRALTAFTKTADLRFDQLTTELIEEFQKWLMKRNVSLNTVSCYLRSLRAVYNRATQRRGDIFVKSFTGSTPTYKRSLCVDDIQRLTRLKLKQGSHLALVRDIFLFSFYCQGMPFVDLAYLRKSQIADGYIIYHRHKTGQMVRIALEPCMMNIIRRYDAGQSIYVFPLLVSTETIEAHIEYKKQLGYYNRSLKRIGRRAGFDKPLTSYVARHSWASIAFQSNVELQTISRAMGHLNPMTTLIYKGARQSPSGYCQPQDYRHLQLQRCQNSRCTRCRQPTERRLHRDATRTADPPTMRRQRAVELETDARQTCRRRTRPAKTA